jgi:molecular chaperone IbpA
MAHTGMARQSAARHLAPERASGGHRKLLTMRIFAMNRFDFTPYRRSTVGFDRLFDLLENHARSNSSDNYPPFNIERRGNDSYRITLAVAGFKAAELDITAQQNLLVVQGRKAEETPDEGAQFLHVGIAQRGFERRFELADFVRVANAGLEDGLLVIDLVREVPDAMKPKKIAIGSAPALTVVETKDQSEAA